MSPVAAYVVETLVTLLAVVALAFLVLYAARRMGVGKPAGPVDLVGRLALDGRRAIYLVRVGKVVYVVGVSEAGMAKIGELDAASLPEPAAAAGTFADALARAVGRKGGRAGETGSDPPSTTGTTASKVGEADGA